ncbi:MAG: Stp1/IreP family PP2C-type Ser/Thr phosphatase [Rhodocyclaceae bacterium]|nr:Stp1/IreP family PP2C-type Ser/Thr phosphatase [Rhodocyclaceae bacterium]
MAAPDLSAALEMAALTDPGRVRANNEDAVLANPRLGLAVLADGMGGYNAGEVASGMTTALLGSELEARFAERAPHLPGAGGRSWAQEALKSVIARANAEILAAASREARLSGMGTTVVAAQFFDDRLATAHVGDSRLYRWRGEALAQLTRDHSLLQEQIDSGMISVQEARYSQNRHIVTRALGVEPEVDIELSEFAVQPGDVYLLCSDGLTDMVEEADIALTLSALSANLPLAAAQLIDLANDNGGRDNVSVILVKVKAPFPARRATAGAWQRLKTMLRTLFAIRKGAQDG